MQQVAPKVDEYWDSYGKVKFTQMFSRRPTWHARASRSTTSRRRAWFLILLGGIYTTQKPASIEQAVLPQRDPEALPLHGHLGVYLNACEVVLFQSDEERMHKPDSQARIRVNGQTGPSGGTAAFPGWLV